MVGCVESPTSGCALGCRQCERDGDPESTGCAVHILGPVNRVTYYDTLELARIAYDTTIAESWDDDTDEARLVEYVDGEEASNGEGFPRRPPSAVFYPLP